ncbi:Glucose--fructose oxidoreductase precursor [Rubripirellula tenax]|uniref:Glucose--fructose oxidoreductase n=1 Tax=Rubripirellula tenax TaxID=2528015 RepID=A0A5C6FCN6_9BACT|nr:Gfo/Idh/MocA family oxidoreductase [Rubripirellula tenax]TWU58482.1 Glucose--fructose oxidoreductase precursor [Rubripirellula tenax]
MTIDRRQFIGTTSALAAAATFGVHQSSAADPKTTVNFALVGLGSLATNQIAPALQKTKHAKLVGVVTGTPSKEKVWADKYGIAKQNIYNYENFDKLAENGDIDVVYIVLPNGMHKEFTVRGAQAGKHVLCEKPMANNSDDCRAMIDACNTADRKLAIGYRCHFEPHHQHCIELARSEKFGELKAIEAGFGFKIGDPNQWRLKGDLAGGGAMMDVGVYALQACRYLTGEEPAEITAQETKTDMKKFAEVDETITWAMKMPSGVMCYCSTSYAFNGINRFNAYGEKGSFGLDPAFGYGGIKGKSSAGPIEFENVDQFAAEMDAFAKCILEDRQSTVSGEEGLRDLLAVEAIYESIRTGQRTKVGSV